MAAVYLAAHQQAERVKCVPSDTYVKLQKHLIFLHVHDRWPNDAHIYMHSTNARVAKQCLAKGGKHIVT